MGVIQWRCGIYLHRYTIHVCVDEVDFIAHSLGDRSKAACYLAYDATQTVALYNAVWISDACWVD